MANASGAAVGKLGGFPPICYCPHRFTPMVNNKLGAFFPNPLLRRWTMFSGPSP